MIWTYSSFSSSSSVTINKSEKPTIAFNGVRISWLIFARKADFNLSDCSARLLAFSSSPIICCRSVISSTRITTPSISPCSLNIGVANTSMTCLLSRLNNMDSTWPDWRARCITQFSQGVLRLCAVM